MPQLEQVLLSLLVASATSQKHSEGYDDSCKALRNAAERAACNQEMDTMCKEDWGLMAFYNEETDSCLCKDGYKLFASNAGCQPIKEFVGGGA